MIDAYELGTLIRGFSGSTVSAPKKSCTTWRFAAILSSCHFWLCSSELLQITSRMVHLRVSVKGKAVRHESLKSVSCHIGLAKL